MPPACIVPRYPSLNRVKEKSEIVGENFFSRSESVIWSILLKYQEIDVQIQTFADKNGIILHSCFIERY